MTTLSLEILFAGFVEAPFGVQTSTFSLECALCDNGSMSDRKERKRERETDQTISKAVKCSLQCVAEIPSPMSRDTVTL